jgi:tripartite ATP-independent transporter DctP family solute receptor
VTPRHHVDPPSHPHVTNRSTAAASLDAADSNVRSRTVRRRLLKALIASPAALLGCTPRGQGSKSFALRLSTVFPPHHPIIRCLEDSAARLRRGSDGRVDLQIFPAGALGSDADVLAQLRSGAVHFMTLSGLTASMLSPVAAVSGVGFAFRDSSQVFSAMDGALGHLIRDALQAHKLFAFPKILENGFRQITTTSKAVSVPADMVGMKIRVPPGAMWTTMFRAMDAIPATLSFAETYTALQTRVVDGQENPLAIISSANLPEVQQYCCMTSHMWDGCWLLANADALAMFPKWLVRLLHEEFERVAVQGRQDVATLNAQLPDQLKRAGMQLIWPDRALFQGALRRHGFYSYWRNAFGMSTWKVLESEVGALS